MIVQALTEFYYSTNGTAWFNNANWLQGDPCFQLWFGIHCFNNAISEMYVNQHDFHY